MLVSFALSQHPPTRLGAQSWCSSPLMGGGSPALLSWALGTWHSRVAELIAEVVLGLGAYSAAQPFSPACVTWCDRGELGQSPGFSA